MTILPVSLTEVFAYIGDAGYIAYIEQFNQSNSIGTKKSNFIKPQYRKVKLEEKVYSQQGKFLRKQRLYTLLLPKLNALD